MDTFTALADPTRRRIIESLALQETSFGALAERFEMSRPAVSQHLKVLRDAGIVVSRAEGQRRIYKLTDSGLDELTIGYGRSGVSGRKVSTGSRRCSATTMGEKTDEKLWRVPG